VFLKLPDAERAEVSREKVEGYLLSWSHPVGSAKARYFASRGYRAESPEIFERDLKRIAQVGDVRSTQESSWGTKYVVVGQVSAPDSDPIELATIWIVEEGGRPILVTAYPWRRRA
jgi:hypothetical protein